MIFRESEGELHVGRRDCRIALRAHWFLLAHVNVVEQEPPARIGVEYRLDAMERIVGLEEREQRVRHERHRPDTLEAIVTVMRSALAAERWILRHIDGRAEMALRIVSGQIEQERDHLPR